MISKFWLMSHLVDARGDRQDEDIVLPGLDLHTVGITHPEPLLGNLGHLSPALTDGVFMIENIALHLQVGARMAGLAKTRTSRNRLLASPSLRAARCGSTPNIACSDDVFSRFLYYTQM
jgi:hypothetical protein